MFVFLEESAVSACTVVLTRLRGFNLSLLLPVTLHPAFCGAGKLVDMAFYLRDSHQPALSYLSHIAVTPKETQVLLSSDGGS